MHRHAMHACMPHALHCCRCCCPSNAAAPWECREALTGQFMLAVGDIRLLSSLQRGCAAAAAKLCPGVTPGSGRMIDW